MVRSLADRTFQLRLVLARLADAPPVRPAVVGLGVLGLEQLDAVVLVVVLVHVRLVQNDRLLRLVRLPVRHRLVHRCGLGDASALSKLNSWRLLKLIKIKSARSRLYRSRFLQVNTRWKALAEIYTMHSFAPLSNLKISVKNR